MTNNRERAVELVGQHVKCGWSICDRRRKEKGDPLPPLDMCPNINPSCRDIAEKIVDHIDGAGYLFPDLPEDNTGEMGSGEWSAGFDWEGETYAGMTEIKHAFAGAWSPGHISASAPRIMTTDQAEGLALALLAAVKSDRARVARKKMKEEA